MVDSGSTLDYDFSSSAISADREPETDRKMKIITIRRKDLKDRKTIDLLLKAGFMLQVAR